MAIADTKKVQTLINEMAKVARAIQAGADRLEQVQSAYVAHNIDPTGTPLEGNLAAVNAWISTIKTLAGDQITQGMISAEAPTHHNKALGV